MNGYLKISLTALMVLGLGACAGTPARYYASNVKAARAAHRPLMVYRFGPAAHRAGIGFINASSQPIRQLTFMMTDYTADHRLVLTLDGKPIEGRMLAVGPFPPGSSRLMIDDSPNLAMLGPCPRLSGIHGVYQDGSTFTVGAQKIDEYVTPQIRSDYAVCGRSYPTSMWLVPNIPLSVPNTHWINP